MGRLSPTSGGSQNLRVPTRGVSRWTALRNGSSVSESGADEGPGAGGGAARVDEERCRGGRGQGTCVWSDLERTHASGLLGHHSFCDCRVSPSVCHLCTGVYILVH